MVFGSLGGRRKENDLLSLTIWVLVGFEMSFHPPVSPEITMRASWYGPGFQGKVMANGEKFNRHNLTVAHRDLPLGTKVLLTNPQTGIKVKAVVKDRGPYVKGRDLDVSEKTARKLELRPDKTGSAPLVVQVLQ